MALSCEANTSTLVLKTEAGEGAADTASFEIKNELDEFAKDLSFLKFIQSDDVYNVEQFVDVIFLYSLI